MFVCINKAHGNTEGYNLLSDYAKCPPLGHITHFCGEVRGILLV